MLMCSEGGGVPILSQQKNYDKMMKLLERDAWILILYNSSDYFAGFKDAYERDDHLKESIKHE